VSDPLDDFFAEALRDLGPAGDRTEYDFEVKRWTHFLPVSHEALLDTGTHVCGDTCPPPPAPLTRRQRIRNRVLALRWRLRRLSGYRLAHKDDLRSEDDW
jgi:hypothetical protein